MRIVFMGSPDFAVPALQKLIDSPENVVAVYSQPPRPAGRGQKEKATPVQALALLHDIPTCTPLKFKEADIENLKSFKPDLICVAAYGMLLPQGVLDVAPCLNIHPSTLPRWRGAAPLHRAVMAGDRTTDVCIMQMELGLDSGPVYHRKSISIGENETTGELHDRTASLGGDMLLDVIQHWDHYKTHAILQEGETIYAHKFKPKELPSIRAINFNHPAQNIHNQVRGLNPWPGATASIHGETLKILNTRITSLEPSSFKEGTVTNVTSAGIEVQCGFGRLLITHLQRSGKKALPVKDFLKGFPINVEDIFDAN